MPCHVRLHPIRSVLAIRTEHGWELRRSTDLRRLAQHAGQRVTAVAFSPDGCRLAVGDGQGLVRIFALGAEDALQPVDEAVDLGQHACATCAEAG